MSRVERILPSVELRIGAVAWIILSALLVNGCQPGSGSVTQLQGLDGVVDRSSKTYNSRLSTIYVQAEKALQIGDLATAESLYRTAVAEFPNDSDGYEALGACLFMQDRFDDAEIEYKRAVAINPSSEDANYGLASIAFAREQYEAACDRLKIVLSTNENNGLSHRLLGMTYEQLGNRERAIRHYERALELKETVGDIDDIKESLESLRMR